MPFALNTGESLCRKPTDRLDKALKDPIMKLSVLLQGSLPKGALGAALLALMAAGASAATYVVPGHFGSLARWYARRVHGEFRRCGPGQSPVLANGLAIIPGSTLTWSAVIDPSLGPVNHPGDDADPNGALGAVFPHFSGAENGISSITGPIDALIGVFLGPDQPDFAPAPGDLDFSDAASQGYSVLSPLLQQAFYMGDGSGKSVVVPAGATRLYLGTSDGFGWDNNGGGFDVTIPGAVPDSCEYGWLAILLVLGLGVRFNRSQRLAPVKA